MGTHDNSRDLALYVGLARPRQLPACRQGMTGEKAWRLYEQAVDIYLAQFPPRERHKHQRGIINTTEQMITELFGWHVWEEFRDARYRAGYHR